MALLNVFLEGTFYFIFVRHFFVMSLLNEELSTTKDCWKLALISAPSHFLCDIYVENVNFFLE